MSGLVPNGLARIDQLLSLERRIGSKVAHTARL